MPFTDRTDAGRRLVQALTPFDGKNPLIVALPRGGVPVGYEVAKGLGAPLDVLVVARIPAPGPGYPAIGATGPGDVRYLDTALIRELGVSDRQLTSLAAEAAETVEDRSRRFRGTSRPLSVRNRIVILVDDGVTTGATARLAARVLRSLAPKRLLLATPVASAAALALLRDEVDGLISLISPEELGGIDRWYREYPEVTDEDVEGYLHRAHEHLEHLAALGQPPAAIRVEPPPPMPQRAIRIPAGDQILDGLLGIPPDARGLVLFGHSSGSNRYTPRNQRLAERLRAAGLATLLVDLLTPEEATEDIRTRGDRDDLELMAERVIAVGDWAAQQANTRMLPVAFYGAHASGALGVLAAGQRPERIHALIARSARMAPVQGALHGTEVPLLLILGQQDAEDRTIHSEALGRMAGPAELVIVPETGPIFEAPEVIEQIAEAVADWCDQHLPGLGPPTVSSPR